MLRVLGSMFEDFKIMAAQYQVIVRRQTNVKFLLVGDPC